VNVSSSPNRDDEGGTSSTAGSASGSSKRYAPRSPRAALEPERVPEPKRPSRRVRHPIVIAGNAIFTIILLIAIAAGVALSVGKRRFEEPGPLPAEKIVNIPKGFGVRDIADLLGREGVIEQQWVFIGGVAVLKLRGDQELKFGEYRFAKNVSVREVVDTLVEGKVVQHTITIPEGLTSEQIVARLMENPILSGNIKEIPKEGTLLPETYGFPRGMTREQIIQRMQQSQRRVVQEIWERRSAEIPVKSPEELITLASIVEKETGKSEERSRVAAVFANRIKQRIKLQSDPTIIYGLVGGKGTLGRPIMRSEIDQPTPYNTYSIVGLPPGPIANPGRASLEATANPARTKELFFVADGTGGHTFSETLDQHQRAVTRWRQIEQQRDPARQAAPADQVPPATQQALPAPEPAAVAPAPRGPKQQQPPQRQPQQQTKQPRQTNGQQ
jgi:UPF0755 protein